MSASNESRFYEVFLSSTGGRDLWSLGTIHYFNSDCAEADTRLFTKGHLLRIESLPPLAVPITETGERSEFSFALGQVPVVTQSLGAALEALAPGDIQRIPVRVESLTEPYEILNVIRVVDAIDEERTVGTKYLPDDHARPDLAGQWKGIGELHLDHARVGTARIFQLSGFLGSIVVDEEVKAVLERASRGLLTLRLIEELDEGVEEDAEPSDEEAAVPRWWEALDSHCERFLGSSPAQLGEIVPSGSLAITLFPHLASPGRPWLTLRTAGVSERPMAAPPGEEYRRHAELVMYLPKDWDLRSDPGYWPVEMLLRLGRFVHDERSWFAPGHTVALAEPGESCDPGTLFSGVMLLAPEMEPDGFDDLVVDATPCRFLWVVPLTEAELGLALDKGVTALRGLLDQHGVGHVIDADRACTVTGRRLAELQ